MKRIFIAASALALLLLFGCTEDKPEEVKTVDFYKQNAAERSNRLEVCQNIPGSFEKDQNCINAMEAGKAQ